MKHIIQCIYGKSELIYNRCIVFERDVDTMRICLSKIMEVDHEDTLVESALFTNGDWVCDIEIVPMRPLPKTFTEEQLDWILTLLEDVRTYVDELDVYPFGYHAQLRVYRNIVLNKIASIEKSL